MTRPPHQRGTDGFTLIEVMASVFLTSIAIGMAVAFYIELTQRTDAAAEFTREGRQATALLDRVSRDLEGAYLLRKPPDVDPLGHPWVFLGENGLGGEGSDRLKFMSRNHRPRGNTGPSSDLAVVSYLLRHGEDEQGYELLRWTAAGIPDSLDREFPHSDDERALVLAEGVDTFAVRFLNEYGEWAEEWDSSLLLDSGELPIAVEIEVALRNPAELDDPDAFDDIDRPEPVHYKRRVLLPVRPVDLFAMLNPDLEDQLGESGGGSDEDDGDGVGGGDLGDLSSSGFQNGPSGDNAAGGSEGAMLRSYLQQHRAIIQSALGDGVYQAVISQSDENLVGMRGMIERAANTYGFAPPP